MRFRTAPVLNMREKHSWHSFSFFLFWRVLVSRPQRVADRVATVFAVWQVQCFCQWGSHLATRGRRPAADITSHCRARQHVRERCEADSGSATTQGVWLFAKQTERQSKKQKKKIHDEEEEDAVENKIWKKQKWQTLRELRTVPPATNGSTKNCCVAFQCFNLGWHK